MKVMATWMTIKELDGVYTSQEYKGRGGKYLVRKLKYWNPFGLHLRYRHRLDDHSDRGHDTISIERIWETKFWTDRNFTWYLAATEVNMALADGHFY